MDRNQNVEIFQDTRRMWETDAELKRAAAESVRRQCLILEGDRVADHRGGRRYETPARVMVSRKRSFEAAAGYPEDRVCVMNFASATNPGGGVIRGANAQEECLCRTSTLYEALRQQAMWEGFYLPHREEGDPLHNDDCIYTPGVVVFKSDAASPELLPREEWYPVDVITIAAPNLRQRPSNRMNPGEGKKVRITDRELEALHIKRLRRVLDVACEQGAETLILGAFGCGAFQNPPQVVARAAKTVLADYLHCFKTVEFAVYCRNRDEQNYDAFAQLFG